MSKSTSSDVPTSYRYFQQLNLMCIPVKFRRKLVREECGASRTCFVFAKSFAVPVLNSVTLALEIVMVVVYNNTYCAAF